MQAAQPIRLVDLLRRLHFLENPLLAGGLCERGPGPLLPFAERVHLDDDGGLEESLPGRCQEKSINENS